MYVITKGQAVSTVIRNEYKALTAEAVLLLVLNLKDTVEAIIRVYVRDQVELHYCNSISLQIERAKLTMTGYYGKESVSASKTSPSQSFTVVINQQGDTSVIEDVHHSNSDHSDSDHSESSSDEGSSDHDEPEHHQSEDDD